MYTPKVLLDISSNRIMRIQIYKLVFVFENGSGVLAMWAENDKHGKKVEDSSRE